MLGMEKYKGSLQIIKRIFIFCYFWCDKTENTPKSKSSQIQMIRTSSKSSQASSFLLIGFYWSGLSISLIQIKGQVFCNNRVRSRELGT